jgi:hypothetical protein
MAARTYGALRSQLLTMINGTGSTELSNQADVALFETMKYIARNVEKLPRLIGRASATWNVALNSQLDIATAFGVTDMRSPRRLFVKTSANQEGYGPEYDFSDFEIYNSVLYRPSYNAPRLEVSDRRHGIQRPINRWTVDYTTVATGGILCYPVQTNDTLTLFYTKEIAAYDVNNSPEVPSDFDQLVLDGAFALMQQYLKDPDGILTMDQILSQQLNNGRGGVMSAIDTLKMHLDSLRPNPRIRLTAIPRRTRGY